MRSVLRVASRDIVVDLTLFRTSSFSSQYCNWSSPRHVATHWYVSLGRLSFHSGTRPIRPNFERWTLTVDLGLVLDTGRADSEWVKYGAKEHSTSGELIMLTSMDVRGGGPAPQIEETRA